MENTGYILAAFIIMWALVFGYLMYLLNRQRRLLRDVESLKESLQDKKKDS